MQAVHDSAILKENTSTYALEPPMKRLLAEHKRKEEIAQRTDTRMGSRMHALRDEALIDE